MEDMAEQHTYEAEKALLENQTALGKLSEHSARLTTEKQQLSEELEMMRDDRDSLKVCLLFLVQHTSMINCDNVKSERPNYWIFAKVMQR